MLITCLIIDSRFAADIVDLLSATHQQGIHTIIDALHALDASTSMEVGEAADVESLALFFSQSSCPHVI